MPFSQQELVGGENDDDDDIGVELVMNRRQNSQNFPLFPTQKWTKLPKSGKWRKNEKLVFQTRNGVTNSHMAHLSEFKESPWNIKGKISKPVLKIISLKSSNFHGF